MNPQDQAAYEQNFKDSIMSAIKQSTASLQNTQSNTQQTQAAIPGTEANSIKAQREAITANAPKQLSEDLANKMTLDQALNKYKALGMNANEIFNQYLSGNTWGQNNTPALPIESPIELQGKGITADALGKIGDTGSFQDKFNAKNAIDELRVAKDYLAQTKASDVAGNIAGVNANSKAYENARLIAGLHLSTLIPGAPGAQATGNSLLNTLPSSKDLRSYTPDMINKSFDAIEKTLLASKGYDYHTLGLKPPPEPQAQNNAPANAQQSQNQTPPPQVTGNNTLDHIIAGAGNDIGNIAKAPVALAGDVLGQLIHGNNPNTIIGNEAINAGKGIIDEYGKATGIGQNGKIIDLQEMLQHAKDHPVNTALDALLPFGLLKAGLTGGVSAAGDTAGADAAALSGAPGKVSQLVAPTRAKNIIGNIRDNLIQSADQTKGNVVSGDAVAKRIRTWADNAKLGNLPDADAIENAAQNAEKQYAGKTFKPSDLKNIYDSIENGFTKNSVPKSSTAAYIDRGVQKVLADNLEQVAPGFKKTSDLFHQTYGAEKSPVRAGVKNLAKYGIPLLVAGEGGRAVSHILFGQ